MAIADDYIGQESLISAAEEWVTITPHDTNQLAFMPKAIMAGGAGTIIMKDKAGNSATVTFAAGEIKALRPVIIMTGGTATPIYALR